MRQQCLPTTWRTVEEDASMWLNAGVEVDFGMTEGHSYELQQLLDAVLDAT